MSDEHFMQMAIEKAKEGISKGQTPFGACIVKGERVICCAHNRVWDTTDITAHAEVIAIREACKILGTIDLSGCTIYSTCEPCPMCFSACHWAKISRIVYGASISDAKEAGFSELTISDEEMKIRGNSPVVLASGMLRDEGARLFKVWAEQGNHRIY